MDETRVERLTELLDRALELPSSQRREFIEAECGGDSDLRAELTSLLEASDSASGYFDNLADEIVSPAYAKLRSSALGGERLTVQLQEALGGGYAIERELGGAGMSRVFLAEEVSLHRKVVIKVLPPELASTVSRDRFRREIQLVAQLQHAHIVPLLSSDSTDTLVWFTMPFVSGESLRARLRRDGALPVREALKLWRDVLDALSHAHSNGVIHRDIKPENILLSGRNALVTDFGVARAIEMSADADTGGAGLAIGTPAYMAPEQVNGDGQIDHRADIYASALVMHEMLAGKQAFAGGTTDELIRARLEQGPPPLVRDDCPDELRALVLRCLERDPDRRPANAESVLSDLDDIPVVQQPRAPRARRIRAAAYSIVAVGLIAVAAFAYQQSRERMTAAPTPGPSLAILPLRNLSGDPADATLADGMTAELNGAIGKATEIKVISRPSIDALAGRGLDSRQIAESLHVSHVLEGDLEKVGSRIRMSIRLLDARDGSTRWAETFDREMGDVFAMQADISRAVALGLGARLAPTVGRRPAPPPTSNIRAYEAYVRGMSTSLSRAPGGRPQAIALLKQAIDEDSLFAAAYAGLAFHYLFLDGPEGLAMVKEAAEKAIALDSGLAQAYSALGWAHLSARDMTLAQKALNRAIALDPNAHRAYEGLARTYMFTGRPAEQLAAARLGIEADPFSPAALREMGLALTMNGRCDEAIELLRPMKALTPPSVVAGVVIGQCHAIAGRWEDAAAELRWADARGARAALGMLGFVLARGGHAEEAKTILADLLAGRRNSHGAFGIAATYAGLGDNENALRWLEKAIDENSERVYIVSPMFRDLQRDPRFTRMLKASIR